MENINLQKISTIKCINSKAEFDGPKLGKLILDDITVIDRDLEMTNFLTTGSYIMYPWNGRIDNETRLKEFLKIDNDYNENIKFPFVDENGFPIHGLFSNLERTVTISENVLHLVPKIKFKNVPELFEKFLITENSLEITTRFENNTEEIQFFSYGYHPYLGMNSININDSINNFIIKSNLNFVCKSTNQLLPILDENKRNLIKEKFDLNGKLNDKKYDDLFVLETNIHQEFQFPYVSITDEIINRTITISSCDPDISDIKFCKKINLMFMQIYTPKKRNCIAIEPMSSPNNAFNLDFPNNLISLNPGEKAVGKIIISVK